MWKEHRRQMDTRVGGAGEEGAHPPGKSAGKGLERKEWRAQSGWGVGAGLGGAGAECARGSSLATPTPGPGPPAPRPTGRTPAGEPRSWVSGIRVRKGDHREFCFCLDGCPEPGNVASLRALRTERVCGANSRVGSWSALRQHDQPGGSKKPGNRLSESRSAKTGGGQACSEACSPRRGSRDPHEGAGAAAEGGRRKTRQRLH